jgi:ribonuclease BN (tRNA processing enzyme)
MHESDSSCHLDRRRLLRTAAIGLPAAALGATLAPTVAAATPSPTVATTPGLNPPAWVTQPGANVVLLGTAGGPLIGPSRAGITSALVVDGHVYLLDAGHGAVDQYVRVGLPLSALTAAFVTHLHSDHVVDLYSLLWLTTGGIGTVGHPVDIYGPGSAGCLPDPYPAGRQVATVSPANPTPGLTNMIRTQVAATAYDINLRMRDEAWPDPRTLLLPHDIPLPDVGARPKGPVAPTMQPFEVMSDARVRVTATLVEHPPVFPSYAFRFDTAYGSVVFSGDTAPTANLTTLACGADILVHEVIDVDLVQQAGLSPAAVNHLLTSHTDSLLVGAIAAEAGVPTLVLNHLSPGEPSLVSDEVWLQKARTGYTGDVLVGHDLQRIPLTGRPVSRQH